MPPKKNALQANEEEYLSILGIREVQRATAACGSSLNYGLNVSVKHTQQAAHFPIRIRCPPVCMFKYKYLSDIGFKIVNIIALKTF